MRQRLESSINALGKGTKRATKLGWSGGSWLYATTPTGSSSTTDNTPDSWIGNSKHELNSQIPVKPVYIAPRNPMVFCHGLYGFDVRGPEKVPLLQVHYWRGVREALEAVGAKVVIAKVPGTGGVRERAHQLNALLEDRLAPQQDKANIIGHSMGGLDARYLITHVNPKKYSVGSLTTVCTPHRGSPFMDWCRDYLSLGYRVDPEQLIKDFAKIWKQQPNLAGQSGVGGGGDSATSGLSDEVLRRRIESIINQAVATDTSTVDRADTRLQEFAQFLTRILGENASVGESSQLAHLTKKSVAEGDYLDRSMALLRMVYRRIMATLDTPAYACLTTDYCNQFFNPSTPDAPGVEYLSIGAHMDPHAASDKVNPLIIPHDIIYKAEGPNDGFVSLTSAQWGHYLGSVCADHFDFTNRWRVTSLGRDFISTVAYWGDKWSAWLDQRNGRQKPQTPDNGKRTSALGGTEFSDSKRFDPIDFYLRIGTILYQRGY